MSDASFNEGDDSGLAAEYVLGLLGREEKRAVEARMGTDPALGAEVVAWTEHFAGIAEAEVAPVTPPRRLRRRIEARLFGSERRNWLQRLGVVPAVLGAAAAALVLLVTSELGLLRPGGADFADPSYQAEIASEAGDLRLVAALAPEARELVLSRLEGAAPAGRVLELWAIPTDTGTPVSLGVLPEGGLTRLSLPEEVADRLAGATLAVSEEPPGGSPTGAPTGQVLATGPVTEL